MKNSNKQQQRLRVCCVWRGVLWQWVVRPVNLGGLVVGPTPVADPGIDRRGGGARFLQ